ncbi:MAG: pyruvate dehydrogenase complex dihydrolipoamide acetyltransferase [Bacteroidetes bacterium]|nr:MAG: pyruvate dehydrogenase complex dihydrolipoamide acetyltransferase [Bacteroidota bacterium]
MAEIIRMPLMSDTMEEGNIVGWLKEVGDTVESGDTLAEVETDKATMELDTYVNGVLLHIAVKEGPVPVDGVIAVIGEKGEDWKAALEAEEASKGGSSDKPAEEVAAEPEAAAPQQAEPVAASAETSSNGRIKASPLAKSMAREAGIDISTIKGSGDSGRIVKRDVEAAIQQGGAAPAGKPQPVPQNLPAPVFIQPGTEGGYEDVPLSQMRKVIARRLGESKFSAPHFYLTIEIDMAEAMKARKQINEMIAPAKISFNDLIVKAAAGALRMHPAVNSSWLEDKIRINHDVNIGVAVAVPDGLLVPVIRHTDRKTLTQINSEVKTLAGKAKERKLQPEEMQGNTFTISNLGMFGIEEFTAIINPPDACIMAVGGIIQKPVVKDGNIVVGHRMKVTLSCDHRVVDGAVGSEFLLTFKALLENPVRLLA